MPDPLIEIDELSRQAGTDIQAVATPDGLEQFRVKWLGTKGVLKAKMALIGQAAPDQKKVVGQKLNELKTRLEEFHASKKTQFEQQATPDAVDVTEPGRRPALGNRHLVMKVIDELTDLFGRMGFAVAEGPEVEDEFHNFVALNIPASHPARDPLDNFYLEPARRRATAAPADADQHGADPGDGNAAAANSRGDTRPGVSPGHDGRDAPADVPSARALVVERNVTMVDLKSTIMQFIHAYFGPQTKARFRPSFFPFTEPSAEVDVWVEAKNKWMELGGCGMVHPNVFKACGIDPEAWSGWAFGLGIERIAMRKYGINDDKGIRHFIENDIRFLRQF